MKRWMSITLALSLLAGLGCEKKKATEVPGAAGDGGAAGAKTATPTPTPTPEAVKPRYADTTPLWALAPADATFGIVMGDGVGARGVDLIAAARKKLEGKPFAKKPLAQIDAWRQQQPIDIFDPASFKAKGIDLSKGFAIYGGADTSKPALIVMPVGDVATFRKTMEATTEKVGDREVDKIKDTVCTTVGTRYACAPTIEAVDAAMKPHDSPLAAAIKALPAEARGDVEGYIDIAKTPEAAQGLQELKQVGDFTTAGGALRWELGSLNLHMWAKGTMSPMALMFTALAPPADLAGLTANATTVLRTKVEPKLLLAKAPPSIPVGDADARTDLLDQLTGDIQVVTAGKGIAAGAIMLKVNDTAKVKKVLAAICAEAKKGGQLPVTSVVAKEDSCTGEISLAMLKDAIGVELPPFKFNFAVSGSLFILAFGDLDPASLKGTVVDAAGSPEAKEALGGAQTFAFWTRGLGIDVGALPKDLADKALADPEVADGISMLNWSGAQAYDMSVAASVSATGAKLTAHVTSMEADPADAKAAYFAAVDKKLGGDRAGYATAMADIEKKFPGTLAARRAALERTGTPVVGPVGTMVVGAAAGAIWFLKMAGEGFTKSTAPGFGEPQPEPTEPPPGIEPKIEEPKIEEPKLPEDVKPPVEPAKPVEEAKPPVEPTKPAEEAKPETSPPPPPPKP